MRPSEIEPWEREISKEEADEWRDQYGGIPSDCVVRNDDSKEDQQEESDEPND